MIAAETDFIFHQRTSTSALSRWCSLSIGFREIPCARAICSKVLGDKEKERKWHWGVFFSFEFSLLVKESKDFSTYASVSLVVARRLRLGCALLRSAKAMKITAMTPQAPPTMVNQDNSWSTESLQYLCVGEVGKCFSVLVKVLWSSANYPQTTKKRTSKKRVNENAIEPIDALNKYIFSIENGFWDSCTTTLNAQKQKRKHPRRHR